MELAIEEGVKRIVITSSIVAIMKTLEEKEVYTEEDHSDISVCKPYEKSKTLAEEKAWELQKKAQAEGKDIEVVTINPGFILGPNLVKCSFTSGDLIKDMVTNVWIRIPRIQYPIVDVRDCAESHLQAIKVPEAKNQRFLSSHDSMWFIDIANLIHKHFGDKLEFRRKEGKYCLVKVFSYINAEAANIVPIWNKPQLCDSSKSKRILGIKYRDTETTIVDMINALLETGYIKANK